MVERIHTTPSRPRYWAYLLFLLPLVCFLMWTIGLIVLLGLWSAQDKWHTPGEPDPVYISDMGAYTKGFFIPMCVITGVSYLFTFIAIRLCRQWRFLYPTSAKIETFLGWFAVLTSAACAACLISLAIRDDVHHDSVHWKFTAAFVVLAFVSAASNIFEWLSAYRHYRFSKLLAFSFYAKFIIIVTAIVCAIAFAGLRHYEDRSRSSRFEWVVGFLWALYISLLCLDVLPAIYHERYPKDSGDLEKGVRGNQEPETTYAPPVEPPAAATRETEHADPSQP
ncbi:plasma membrane protein [Schizosaccharomyces cryophilus OY26]|uniref:Plasma membrane protein n=1 Tax=Schizosaccharomyces cryophilus (strain OY26 / ATCC MYA-4695 / CBS 11777 / NBRC 106824 / NRRL Y48691) TaxID=653667 RepID=S9WYH8_SCHCR|nr:plasma membrane protein [Schizosaccharomyces cryophilus OY26]EPY49802.1 plasma membrane protein [Schizosaccharomyces cryophilus OY26]